MRFALFISEKRKLTNTVVYANESGHNPQQASLLIRLRVTGTAPSNSDLIILVYYWTAQYAIKYVAREVCQVFIRAGKMVEYGIFTVRYCTGL